MARTCKLLSLTFGHDLGDLINTYFAMPMLKIYGISGNFEQCESKLSSSRYAAFIACDALWCKYPELAKFAIPHVTDENDRRDVLGMMISAGHNDAVRILLDAGIVAGGCSLSTAARQNNVALIKMLAQYKDIYCSYCTHHPIEHFGPEADFQCWNFSEEPSDGDEDPS